MQRTGMSSNARGRRAIDLVSREGAEQPEDEQIPAHELPQLIESLRREMREAAKELEFERAAELRDRIQALEGERLRLG